MKKNEGKGTIASPSEVKHCIVQMFGGLDPILYGSYVNKKAKSRAAKRVHEIMNEEDTLFGMDIEIKVKGLDMTLSPHAFTYSGGFFKESEG